MPPGCNCCCGVTGQRRGGIFSPRCVPCRWPTTSRPCSSVRIPGSTSGLKCCGRARVETMGRPWPCWCLSRTISRRSTLNRFRLTRPGCGKGVSTGPPGIDACSVALSAAAKPKGHAEWPKHFVGHAERSLTLTKQALADTSDRSIEDPAVIDRILAHVTRCLWNGSLARLAPLCRS